MSKAELFIELPLFLSLVGQRREEGLSIPEEPLLKLDGETILDIARANRDIIVNFRTGSLPRAEPSRRSKTLLESTNIFSLEPCFTTANAIDLITERFILYKSTAFEIYGASFLKPEKEFSADLIFYRWPLMIIADGASMIAKLEDKGFPEEIKEKCLVEQEFMPDVLWTTIVAELLEKEDFFSPFAQRVKRVFQESEGLQEIIRSIKAINEPNEAIELISKGIGEFNAVFFETEIDENNKKYFPSGVMGVVNLKSFQWASTGDIRVGYTCNKYGSVAIVNDYQKVDRHDAAVRDRSREAKLAFAQGRAEKVGSLQGLPIEIETGSFPVLHPTPKLGGKGAIVLWTDGEDIQTTFHDQWQQFIGRKDQGLSFSGTLLVREPLLHHLYLLHCQHRFSRRLQADIELEGKAGYTTNLLKRVRKKPPWREDDAAFIIGYVSNIH